MPFISTDPKQVLIKIPGTVLLLEFLLLADLLPRKTYFDPKRMQDFKIQTDRTTGKGVNKKAWGNGDQAFLLDALRRSIMSMSLHSYIPYIEQRYLN